MASTPEKEVVSCFGICGLEMRRDVLCSGMEQIVIILESKVSKKEYETWKVTESEHDIDVKLARLSFELSASVGGGGDGDGREETEGRQEEEEEEEGETVTTSTTTPNSQSPTQTRKEFVLDRNSIVLSFSLGRKDDDPGELLLACPPDSCVRIRFHTTSNMILMLETLRKSTDLLESLASQRLKEAGKNRPTVPDGLDSRGIRNREQAIKINMMLQMQTARALKLTFKDLFAAHSTWLQSLRKSGAGAGRRKKKRRKTRFSGARRPPPVDRICWSVLNHDEADMRDYHDQIWGQPWQLWTRPMFETWLKSIFVQGHGTLLADEWPTCTIDSLWDRLSKTPSSPSMRTPDRLHARSSKRMSLSRKVASLLTDVTGWFEDFPVTEDKGKLWLEDLISLLGNVVLEEGQHPLDFLLIPELTPEREALQDAVRDLEEMEVFPQGKYLIISKKRDRFVRFFVPRKSNDLREVRKCLRENRSLWDWKTLRSELLFRLIFGMDYQKYGDNLFEKFLRDVRQNQHFVWVQSYRSTLEFLKGSMSEEELRESIHPYYLNYNLVRLVELMKVEMRKAEIQESLERLTSPLSRDGREGVDEDKMRVLRIEVDELIGQRDDVSAKMDEIMEEEEEEDGEEVDEDAFDALQEQYDELDRQIKQKNRVLEGTSVVAVDTEVVEELHRGIAECESLEREIEAFLPDNGSPSDAFVRLRSIALGELVSKHLRRIGTEGSFFLIPLRLCIAHLQRVVSPTGGVTGEAKKLVQVGRFLKLEGASFGAAHAYPTVLNTLFHWDNSMFVTIQTRDQNEYSEIVEADTKTPLVCDGQLLDSVVSRVSQFVVVCNSARRYEVSGLSQSGLNCQNFSIEVLRLLGAIGFPESVKKCFDNIAKTTLTGERHLQRQFSFDFPLLHGVNIRFQEVFRPAFIGLHKLWENDENDTRWNEMLSRSYVAFQSHAQLAAFVRALVEICPSFPQRAADQWLILESFCSAFTNGGDACRSCVFQEVRKRTLRRVASSSPAIARRSRSLRLRYQAQKDQPVRSPEDEDEEEEEGRESGPLPPSSPLPNIENLWS